jgi:hypothetical protein
VMFVANSSKAALPGKLNPRRVITDVYLATEGQEARLAPDTLEQRAQVFEQVSHPPEQA